MATIVKGSSLGCESYQAQSALFALLEQDVLG